MATEDALRFCDLVASPDFPTKHPDLVQPLADAARTDDPDAVASLAAAKLGLHFTGEELKHAGGHVGAGAAQIVAATQNVSFFGGGFTGIGGDYRAGPGGLRMGLPFVGVPGADIAMKIAMQTIARQLQKEGKSTEEIRQVITSVAGGSPEIDKAAEGKSITGIGFVDDVIKSTASVAVGLAEGFEDTVKKIFSGW